MGLLRCEYTIETFATKDISRVVMVTDGIFEWEQNGEIWGWDAFLKFCENNRGLPSDAFMTQLAEVIQKENGDAPLADDQTCIIWSNL